MSLGETILAIFGTRKLSTSKDYRLLKKNIETLYENDRVLRDMLWSTMTDEQKREFIKKYKEERFQREQSHQRSDVDDTVETIKKAGIWILTFFGLLFVLWFIFSIIIYLII
ncbi:hypothetical protein DRN45_07395 [Thermococci archaeon]|nr:MAG: hypothetical protein DRN45_07395 [Thermococci archaeon]